MLYVACFLEVVDELADVCSMDEWDVHWQHERKLHVLEFSEVEI